MKEHFGHNRSTIVTADIVAVHHATEPSVFQISLEQLRTESVEKYKDLLDMIHRMNTLNTERKNHPSCKNNPSAPIDHELITCFGDPSDVTVHFSTMRESDYKRLMKKHLQQKATQNTSPGIS